MSVILYNNIGVRSFYCFHNFSKHYRTSDAGHIFQTYFFGAGSNQLFRHVDVIIGRMYFGIGDTHGGLRYHTGSFSILYGRNNVAHIIQSAENTSNINSLSFFYLVHKFTHIGRHRVHAYSVKSAVEHMSLDASFVEWLCKCAYCIVWVFAKQQIYLLRCATIGFDACKTPHLYNDRCNFF